MQAMNGGVGGRIRKLSRGLSPHACDIQLSLMD